MLIQQNQVNFIGQSWDGVFDAQYIDILDEIEIRAGPACQNCFQVEVQFVLGRKLAAFKQSIQVLEYPLTYSRLTSTCNNRSTSSLPWEVCSSRRKLLKADLPGVD